MGIFSRFFTKRSLTWHQVEMSPFDVRNWTYVPFNGNILQMDLIRASIDALARNIAKMELQATYPGRDGTKKIDISSDVAKVLQRPNPYMSTYDFLYKISAMYYATNNAFIWPQYDNGKLVALWPINYQSVTIKRGQYGLYVTFQLKYTQEYTIPYDAVIHLRNHYITDDIVGDTNIALSPVSELINAQNQGIIQGIKNSAMIRGILKSINVIKDEDLQKRKEQFIKDNLQASNNGGVIAVDGRFDYQQIESKPYVVDAETQSEAKKRVFAYFGVNEAFITGQFDTSGYEAIYETRLEPFMIMLTQALSYGLYTQRERDFGNRIEANMSRVKFQPINTVTNMINATNQLGLFTRNEFREMLGYPPLSEDDGGNEIMTSLNYTNSKTLDEYQGVKGDENGENNENLPVQSDN